MSGISRWFSNVFAKKENKPKLAEDNVDMSSEDESFEDVTNFLIFLSTFHTQKEVFFLALSPKFLFA